MFYSLKEFARGVQQNVDESKDIVVCIQRDSYVGYIGSVLVTLLVKIFGLLQAELILKGSFSSSLTL